MNREHLKIPLKRVLMIMWHDCSVQGLYFFIQLNVAFFHQPINVFGQLPVFKPTYCHVSIRIDECEQIFDVFSVRKCASGHLGNHFDDLSELEFREPPIRVLVELVEQSFKEFICGQLPQPSNFT